jgi:hypothetical protein
MDFDYAGIGIAIATLIDSAARLTIRHSDNPPIASETATAWFSRDEATDAPRLLKPKAPGDRIMAGILARANHPQGSKFRKNRRQYWGGGWPENGGNAAKTTVMPAV